jgi:iron-sulfur cluster assembly accessory protein
MPLISTQQEEPLVSATQQAEDVKDTATGVVLTDAAAEKVKALIAQEGEEGLALRVEVSPGGCSGLRYGLFFDTDRREGDVISSYEGFEVVVDRMSVPYLMGASIDFAAPNARRKTVPRARIDPQRATELLSLD